MVAIAACLKEDIHIRTNKRALSLLPLDGASLQLSIKLQGMASTPARPAGSRENKEAWAGSRSASVGVFGHNAQARSTGSLDGDSSSHAFGAQNSSAGGMSTPSGSRANGRNTSTAARPRKSALPDIGTPIKVASSSPYRTPESTSKASIFLSRTPFGTPAKAQAAAASSSSSTLGTPAGASSAAPYPFNSRMSGSGAPSAPVKPVTSGRGQALALCKSLYDGGSSYAVLALQARPFLPYSSLLKNAARANWFRFGVTMLAAHHFLVCMALASPSHPFQSATLTLRPYAIFLSLASYALLVAIVSLAPSHALSMTKPMWSAPSKFPLQDTQLGSITFPSSSPAGLALTNVRRRATWQSVFLQASFGFCLAATNAAGLLYFGDAPHRWTPYMSVPVRLANGQRSHALRPNERFFFLLLANTAICAIFALWQSLDTSSPRRAAATPFQEPEFDAQAAFSSPYTRLLHRLKREGQRAVAFGLLAPPTALHVYLLFRRPLFRLVLSVIGHHSPLRPILVPSFRRPLLSGDLLVRGILLGLASVLLLELFSVAWEVCATQPVEGVGSGVSTFAREPMRTLIHGMQLRRSASSEEGAAALGAVERDYLSHFAFSEMAIVASTDVERRRAIFRDVSGSSTMPTSQNGMSGPPSAWAQIASECLAALKEEIQWIDNRGRAPVAKAPIPAGQFAAPPPAWARARGADDAHRISLASGSDVLKTATPSIWDKLASAASGGPATGIAKTVPSNAAPSTSAPRATTNAASTSGLAQTSGGLGTLLHRIAPSLPREVASTASSTRGPGQPITATTKASTSGQSVQQPITPATVLLGIITGSIGIVWVVLQRVHNALPSDVQHVLTQSPLSRRVLSSTRAFIGLSQSKASATAVLVRSGTLPHDAALAIWSVQTLSALLAASLDQDEYGTVALSAASQQCGMDDVLEIFATLLIALQGLASELHEGKDASDVRSAIAVFDEIVGPLITALRTGITLVVGAFEPTGVHLRPTCRQLVDKALAVGGVASSAGPEMAQRGG